MKAVMFLSLVILHIFICTVCSIASETIHREEPNNSNSNSNIEHFDSQIRQDDNQATNNTPNLYRIVRDLIEANRDSQNNANYADNNTSENNE